MEDSQRGFFPAAVRDSIIFVGSVLLVLIFTKFNLNIFFADDNAMQWEIVTKEIFDNLFSDGYIAYRNIYQYKGLDIFSSGYYGQTNIFMFVSYLISRFVTVGKLHILAIYIPMLYGLGNIFMTRLLLDCLNIRKSIVCAMIAMYSCVTIFFSYSFYYFTFNNYFFIPFFLWIFIKTRESRLKWFAPGLILSFGLYLGHAQYAFYYVIIYAVVVITLSIIHKNIKEIYVAAANGAVYLAVSGIYLLCLLNASSDRSMIFDKEDFFGAPLKVEFFLIPVDFSALMSKNHPIFGFEGLRRYVNCGFIGILFFLLFLPTWKRAVVFLFRKINANKDDLFVSQHNDQVLIKKMLLSVIVSALMFCCCYLLLKDMTLILIVTLSAYIVFSAFLFISPGSSERKQKITKSVFFVLIFILSILLPTLFTAILLISAVVKLIKRKRPTKKHKHGLDLICAFSSAAIFLLLLSWGEMSPLTQLFYRVPVINGFRFLYKCAFLIIPLMMPAAAYVFEHRVSPKFKKPLVAASLCCAVLQGGSICFFIWGENIDLLNQSNYNFINHKSFLEQSRVLLDEKIIDSRDYRFLACANIKKSKATSIITACIFEAPYKYTKNYATANGIFSLGGYDNIFTTESFNQSNEIMSETFNEGNMCNAVCDFDRFNKISESEHKRLRFEDQMIENGVKYVLFTKSDTEFIASFERLIDLCPRLSITDRFDGLEDVLIIALEGMKPICSDTADNSRISISPKLSELTFNADGTAKTVKISLTFDSGYHMTLNGNDIPLFRTDDGYITADIPAEEGEARLYYENRVMDVTMLTACVTTALSAALVLVCLLRKKAVSAAGKN